MVLVRFRDLDYETRRTGSEECWKQESWVVRRLGFEPRAHGLKGRCSTELSYRPRTGRDVLS